MGIVFIEDLRKNKNLAKLNFDQFACSYLLVQMNFVQKIFDFNIVEVDFNSQYSLPNRESIKSDNEYILKWFDNILTTRSKTNPNIDYWFGITSEHVRENWFFDMKFQNETTSKKLLE